MISNPFKPKPNWENPVNHNLSDLGSDPELDSSVLFIGMPKPIAFALLALGVAGNALKQTLFPPKEITGVNFRNNSIRDLGPNKDVNEL